MSMRDPLPPMPDLGPARTIDHPSGDPDLWLGNAAWVVRMARDGGTPQSDKFYRTFCAAYDRLKGLPLAQGKRQELALEEAVATIGFRLDYGTNERPN